MENEILDKKWLFGSVCESREVKNRAAIRAFMGQQSLSYQE